VASSDRPVGTAPPYLLIFGEGEADGATDAAAAGAVTAGFALATGEALGLSAAEEAGEADAAGIAEAAGDVAPAGAVCCLSNSRRSALSPLVLCAYNIDNPNVSAKKIPASQAVIFTSTLVVCAPKIFSVTPPPNAAPKPSLRGRCIRITSNMSSATKT